MRPNIADSLEKRMEKEVDESGSKLYRLAGFTNKSSFVADAVREKLEKEEEKYLE